LPWRSRSRQLNLTTTFGHHRQSVVEARLEAVAAAAAAREDEAMLGEVRAAEEAGVVAVAEARSCLWVMLLSHLPMATPPMLQTATCQR
jgi:hypothetical protein